MGRSKKKSSKKIAELPPEIITDILTRLPVKTLIRFKCVSKTFLNLITNPHFIKTHLKLSQKDPNLAHFNLILSSVQPDIGLKSCSLQEVLNCKSNLALELDYSLSNPVDFIKILGSFNGLICIAIEEDNLFIWNPSTRVYKMLPDHDVNLSERSFRIYGFGFDERIDDYKVVGVFSLVGNDGSYEIVPRIYSLRADSWKDLGEFPMTLPNDEPGKFANGSLHWSGSMGGYADIKWFIVSIDLVSETYGEIEQPDFGNGVIGLTLGVLQGLICVLSNFERAFSDLWIMKEYGVRGSWVKMYTIPYVGDPGYPWYYFPIWITENGEILMELGACLVIYNPHESTFRNPVVFNLNGFGKVATYVESLVAPNFGEPVEI